MIDREGVVAAFEAHSAAVTDWSGSWPLLVVGIKGETFLVDVPDGRDGMLSPEQEQWHETWPGGAIHVIRNAPEAHAFIRNVIGNRRYGL